MAIKFEAASDRACMSSAVERLISDNLRKNVRMTLLYFNRNKTYEFGLAIRRSIEKVMATRSAGAYGVALLQAAAAAMGSDIRLVEARPGTNNYVIDELVAASWYQAGNFTNALSKEKEALDDLPRTRFPSGEAKDVALAGIYLQISRAQGKLNNYAEQAAYEQAANALGGRNGYEHAMCFASFKIAPFADALAACAQALAVNKDDMETYYWRAQLYIDHGMTNDALPDLARVASSRLAIRALAAIDMSKIYFDRGNNASALNILERYSFLYDEKVSSRENIAIAYNNRCYAHMQLGDLRLALNDCDASLRYGNLPDAYQKREELARRMKGLPI